ncbi:MAG: transcriptional regulator [Campylobacterales bacterium]|nr:transcriptional regulator [Campylobacterales bacterium]
MRFFLLTVFISNLLFAQTIDYSIKNNTHLRMITNDKPFSTDIIKGKRFLLNYVDPDARELNRAFMRELEAFNKGQIGSIAIINLAATWLPNSLIESELKKSQKAHPTTIYVKDYNKVLVKKWELKDDDYNTLIFDKNRKLLFKAHGKLTPKQQQKIKAFLGAKD